MDKIDVLSLEFNELLQIFLEHFNEKKFRASQVFDWLHNKKVSSFEEMSNISSALRQKLSDYFYIDRLVIAKKLESKLDPTVKYLYKLSDNNHIESVLMEYKHGNSLCISTQVGCKMGCKFCASTLAGFARHLTVSEMLLQVYNAEIDSGKHVDSIVLMGIGEPLDNYGNVVKFLKLLSDERGKNLSLRHVSLSTCGLVDEIYALAEYKFGLTLSISLHATTNEKRTEIMPINRKFSIEELLKACRFYIDKTGRRISFEYAVIEGVNDKKSDADELSALLKGMLCHVNLIPVNSIAERDFRSSKSSICKFASYLENNGLNATIRRTLGNDINAACGQLRRQFEI